MRPCPTLVDARDGRFRHAVFPREAALRAARRVDQCGTDSEDLIIGELGASVRRASASRAMASLVFFVLFLRAPTEVFKSVVGRVSVEMPAFHAWWSWSDKGFENESVRCPGSDAWDVSAEMAPLSERELLEDAPVDRSELNPSRRADEMVDRSHAAEIADLVTTFTTHDWKPAFHLQDVA